MDELLLPAVQKAYDINRWLIPYVEKLPRVHKFTLGDRLQSTALDLQLDLVEAAHSRSKQRPLYRANRRLDQFRILLRLARDTGVLTSRQHEHVGRWNEELGRQIGGWLRSTREGSAPAVASSSRPEAPS